MTLSADNLTLPLIFGAGMLGSSHCLGMCGAISVSMSAGTRTVRESLLRQLSWSCGRTFTYGFLGLMSAALGGRLIASSSGSVDWQAWLAMFAGVLMVGQGLHTAGWLRFPALTRQAGGCPTTSILRQLLQGGSSAGAFIAGLVTGFLPCGLVYSFLLLAASTGNVLLGPLIMIVFGAGTMPVMLATGTGMSLIGWSARRRMLNLAAWCVLIAGIVTFSRGVVFAVATDSSSEAPCPFCETDDELLQDNAASRN